MMLARPESEGEETGRVKEREGKGEGEGDSQTNRGREEKEMKGGIERKKDEDTEERTKGRIACKDTF